MMTPAPDSDEAQQALHAVRQQQVNLIRRNLAPLPAWGWLAGAAQAREFNGAHAFARDEGLPALGLLGH